MNPHNPPHIVVTRNQLQIVLTLAKHPIRGVTQAEWLEQECYRVLGKDEMAWCGSRWRKRVQDEPRKLERVLADMRVQRREGKRIFNPGGYAEDLWRRWA